MCCDGKRKSGLQVSGRFLADQVSAGLESVVASEGEGLNDLHGHFQGSGDFLKIVSW